MNIFSKVRLLLNEVTDTDLPPNRRTQANLYKAEYFKMWKEVQNAHKGIRRLKRKNEALREKLEDKP